MIRFNNDYNRGAFDCILKALADTNTTSYPGYGEDEWCDKAEQRSEEHTSELQSH